MKYLNFSEKELKTNGGYFTAKEISQQPEMWKEVYSIFLKEKDAILEFLEKILNQSCPNFIFTGAGTSAFIGEALAGAFRKKWNISATAIATTDIVTHPEHCFLKTRPTLLISFARSGDSPESLAAVELAEKYCDDIYQLIITCNKDGELAKKSTSENSYVFLLPEETNDRSLAMTSSFSTMLLSGLLLLNIKNIENMKPIIEKISSLGKHILDEGLPIIKKTADLQFHRAVFLGSGPLFGIAHESHLKVQEMTDGNVICKFDSFLGFRHGPKAVVNDKTLIVYLLSNNARSKLYEIDLVSSISNTCAGEKTFAIGIAQDERNMSFDYTLKFPSNLDDIPEEFLSIFYVLPSQILGFFKSLSLGLSPDSPSKNDSITRVVQGVKIYL